MQTAPHPARQSFTCADAALTHLQQLYDEQTAWLRGQLQACLDGWTPEARQRAHYPSIRLTSATALRQVDSRLSYGFVAGPGRYETSITRPHLFADYLREQMRLLLANHEQPLEIGLSREPIALHFALREGEHLEGSLDAAQRQRLRDWFDLPNLAAMDDGIANGTYEPPPGAPRPLALFTAARTDYSLHRLRHYSGTAPEHFQNFVLFTNYQFYIDEFVRLGRALAAEPSSGYSAFIEPSGSRLPQMPAYHLMGPAHNGITMVNIGVGPANAKTITDHVAVLRPHAWLMLGHCAGLRNSQRLGDYVLAHGYVREDHVLDEDLPPWVPIPALSEVQLALESAVAEVTQLTGYALKRVLRTGTVASTDNRNWELLPHPGPERRFSQSRAIAADMESATIAANGFRFRVPYGTLLCVSDKPLHGDIKLPGMADQFYRARVDQHLRIGIRALERLRAESMGRLHSRKLRSFDEVAFQ